MDNPEYVFITTFFNKEELRIAILSLSEANIRFRINNKSNPTSGRAPLSTYFEADLFIAKNDFSAADVLVQNITKSGK